jgi:hypothetical protein
MPKDAAPSNQYGEKLRRKRYEPRLVVREMGDVRGEGLVVTGGSEPSQSAS